MPKSNALGLLLLRVTLGSMMLFHGIGKVLHGVDGIVEGLHSHGLPGFIAYGVYVGEVLAPLLLIIGLYTRPAAWILAFNMLVAVALAHSADVLRLTENGTWPLELQAFYFFGAVAVALMGPGKWSVSKAKGRWD